jgi:hypothetical protein
MKNILKGIIAVGVCSLIAIVAITYFDNTNMENNKSGEPQKPRAALLDMLYSEEPNAQFDDTIEKDLTDSGYQVDTYKTRTITVDLYRNLPSMGYKIIIFRTHGLNSGTFGNSSSIFTGEIYSTNKYFIEQLTGDVGGAVPYLYSVVRANGDFGAFVNETYFVIGSKFIDESMVGKFPDSVILIAGCDAMSNDLLAKSFVARGASVVVGWNGLVSLSDNDRGILMIVHKIAVDRTSVSSAVIATMGNMTADPVFPGVLKYYGNDVTL